MKEEYGIYPIRAVRSMRAEIIKPSLAPLLHVERKGPIHLIESITFDQFERPMDYSLETLSLIHIFGHLCRSSVTL